MRQSSANAPRPPAELTPTQRLERLEWHRDSVKELRRIRNWCAAVTVGCISILGVAGNANDDQEATAPEAGSATESEIGSVLPWVAGVFQDNLARIGVVAFGLGGLVTHLNMKEQQRFAEQLQEMPTDQS